MHQHAEGDDADRQYQHGDGEIAGQVCELFLQRCLTDRNRLHHGVDGADLGAGTGIGNHAARGTGDHHGAHEHHVMTFGQRRDVGHHRRLLAKGVGFTGQRGFIAAQFLAGEQPHIGRHTVACLQLYEIAGHQRDGIHAAQLSVALHQAHRRRHGENGAQGFFCLAFLNETDDAVDDDDRENNASVDIVSEHDAEPGAEHQHIDEEAAELAQQALPGRCRRFFRKTIGSG